MQTEALYEIRHEVSNAIIGIGNEAEIDGLCRDGLLPPREDLTLVLVGTYPLAA